MTRPPRAARPASRRPPILLASWLGAVGLLVGCGDGKKPHSADDVEGAASAAVAPAPDPAPEPSIKPLEDGGGSSSSHDGSASPSDGPEDDYLLTHGDCSALADAYGRSWQNDEMTKLDAKQIKGAQYDRAATQIRDGARDAADNWLSECQKIVGTAMLRSRLACATKAKGMQRFNDCWDGKAQ